MKMTNVIDVYFRFATIVKTKEIGGDDQWRL